jgi:hypothetical protein
MLDARLRSSPSSHSHGPGEGCRVRCRISSWIPLRDFAAAQTTVVLSESSRLFAAIKEPLIHCVESAQQQPRLHCSKDARMKSIHWLVHPSLVFQLLHNLLSQSQHHGRVQLLKFCQGESAPQTTPRLHLSYSPSCCAFVVLVSFAK